MISSMTRPVRKLRIYDDTRDSFPGEHWVVLGIGVALLVASSRSPSPLKRAIGSALSSALLMRAASGRDGIAKLVRYMPQHKGVRL